MKIRPYVIRASGLPATIGLLIGSFAAFDLFTTQITGSRMQSQAESNFSPYAYSGPLAAPVAGPSDTEARAIPMVRNNRARVSMSAVQATTAVDPVTVVLTGLTLVEVDVPKCSNVVRSYTGPASTVSSTKPNTSVITDARYETLRNAGIDLLGGPDLSSVDLPTLK